MPELVNSAEALQRSSFLNEKALIRAARQHGFIVEKKGLPPIFNVVGLDGFIESLEVQAWIAFVEMLRTKDRP